RRDVAAVDAVANLRWKLRVCATVEVRPVLKSSERELVGVEVAQGGQTLTPIHHLEAGEVALVEENRRHRHVHQERLDEPRLPLDAPAVPTLVLRVELVSKFLLAPFAVELLPQHSQDARERVPGLLRDDADLPL